MTGASGRSAGPRLIKRHAIGLITTHDLALAAITDTLDGQAANIHFEDQIEDGKMRFDYLIRPGVVKNSNAIQLMRSVGWRFDGGRNSRAGAAVRLRVGRRGGGAAV